MLIGFLLGALIVALIVAVLILLGKCAAYAGLNKTLNKELYDTQTALGRMAVIEQERRRIKENVVVNFTEEQITALAGKISARVKTILDNETQAALNKLS